MRSITGSSGVHLVGRQQDGDVVFLRQAVQQPHDLLCAAWIEVGERFVEQEQLRPADERVGDEDPLLFATRERPDPAVGELLGTDVGEGPVDGPAVLLRPPAEPEAVAVETECDEVPRPHRYVGVEDDLLGHVAQRSACPARIRPLRCGPCPGRPAGCRG